MAIEIEKNLVFDKTNNKPIAVLIQYEDWLKVEKLIFEYNRTIVHKKENELSGAGSLEIYKDLNKINKESKAWENAVLEEYENS